MTDQNIEAGFKMEKHETVAVSQRKHLECSTTTQGGNTSVIGIIEGVSGTSWLPSGPVRRTGLVKEQYAMHLKITKRFVTFALDSVNHPTAHKTRTGNKKNVDDKAPRILGPAHKTIHTREEGPTVQLFGDSEVAGKWIHGNYSWRQNY